MTLRNQTRGIPQPSKRSGRFDFTLVGDTNLDILLYGLPESLPAEQELLADAIAIRVGGSGAITSHNLAALGNSVGFVTTVTTDDFGGGTSAFREPQSRCDLASAWRGEVGAGNRSSLA
jgi:bifunctional ADP-heptose synthase (sugar kinase/adenylyltransferase)